MKSTIQLNSNVKYYTHNYDPENKKYVVKYLLTQDDVDEAHIMTNARKVVFNDFESANKMLLQLRRNLVPNGGFFIGCDKNESFNSKLVRNRSYFSPANKNDVFAHMHYVDLGYRYYYDAERSARGATFGKRGWRVKDDIKHDLSDASQDIADLFSPERVLGGLMVGLFVAAGICIVKSLPQPSDPDKKELKVVAWQLGEHIAYTDVATGQNVYALKPKGDTTFNIVPGDTLVLGFNNPAGQRKIGKVVWLKTEFSRPVYYIQNQHQR